MKQIKTRGRPTRFNTMDGVGRIRIQIGRVVPGRYTTFVSGNIHRSLSFDDTTVSEIYAIIAKALGVEVESESHEP